MNDERKGMGAVSLSLRAQLQHFVLVARRPGAVRGALLRASLVEEAAAARPCPALLQNRLPEAARPRPAVEAHEVLPALPRAPREEELPLLEVSVGARVEAAATRQARASARGQLDRQAGTQGSARRRSRRR